VLPGGPDPVREGLPEVVEAGVVGLGEQRTADDVLEPCATESLLDVTFGGAGQRLLALSSGLHAPNRRPRARRRLPGAQPPAVASASATANVGV